MNDFLICSAQNPTSAAVQLTRILHEEAEEEADERSTTEEMLVAYIRRLEKLSPPPRRAMKPWSLVVPDTSYETSCAHTPRPARPFVDLSDSTMTFFSVCDSN